MTTKILVVDDHHVVRRGLVFFLRTQKGIDIVAEAGNGLEAIELTKQHQPDLILMDLSMPEMDGIEATKKIKSLFPDIKIIILTSFSEKDHVIPALEAGASGYQLKDIDPDELVLCIQKVMLGTNELHPKATNHLLANLAKNSHPSHRPLHDLTKRELDVLKEIAKGKSNKEIATTLFITEKTVKTHVSNLLSKLELADRTQAALYAVKQRLTE